MKNIVEFQNVKKTFSSKEVLKNINFKIGQQEIVGLVGGNGAGKTTLMRILVGLTQKYEGIISTENRQTRVGCVIESPNFYNYMTGYQNLKHFSNYTNSNKQEIVELLDIMGLSEEKNKKVKYYSLGMRQRLGIAQALLGKPDIVILDEPTNGLDPQGVQEMRHYLKEIVQTRKVSILISSHILSEIEKVCDRVMLLKEGILEENINSIINSEKQVVEYLLDTQTPGELIDFCNREKLKATRNGDSVVMSLESKKIFEVLRKLINENISFDEITQRKMSLEDHFIQLVGGVEK